MAGTPHRPSDTWHHQTGGSQQHSLLGSTEKAKLCLCLDFRLLASGYDTIYWCECPDRDHLLPPPCKANKHRSYNCFSCLYDLQNLTLTNTDYKHSYGI